MRVVRILRCFIRGGSEQRCPSIFGIFLKNGNKISHPTVNDAKLSLKVLPWNVPSSHGSPLLSPLNIFKIAQMDCYFRTISKYSSDAFESSIYLGPSQILVPKTTKQNVHIQSMPKGCQNFYIMLQLVRYRKGTRLAKSS